jgi:anti-sigma B factor antagonist
VFNAGTFGSVGSARSLSALPRGAQESSGHAFFRRTFMVRGGTDQTDSGYCLSVLAVATVEGPAKQAAGRSDQGAGMAHQPRFLRRQDFDGFTVAFIDGEIDVAVAGILAEELESTVEACSPMLLVDLTNVTFMDSSALSTLIRVHKYATVRGGGLRLVGPNARVSRLLSITHVDQVLPVHESVEAAANGLDASVAGSPGLAGLAGFAGTASQQGSPVEERTGPAIPANGVPE